MKFRCVEAVLGKLTKDKVYEGSFVAMPVPVNPIMPQQGAAFEPLVMVYDDSKNWTLCRCGHFALVGEDNLIEALEYARKVLASNPDALGVLDSMLTGKKERSG